MAEDSEEGIRLIYSVATFQTCGQHHQLLSVHGHRLSIHFQLERIRSLLRSDKRAPFQYLHARLVSGC